MKLTFFSFPENVEIVCEDANDADWGDHPYSFIHTRMLLGCFTDFREIINRSFKYLEPGGWMESQEIYPTLYCDFDTLKEDNSFLDWTKRIDEAYMKVGRPLRIGNKLKRWYEVAGFVDIHEEVFKLPINEWLNDPKFKAIGEYHRKSLVKGLSAFSLRPFHQAFGWTHDETQIYLAAAKNALLDTSTQAYYNVYVCKPLCRRSSLTRL
jgi:metalloendopeptidase OMA1, mitochondrial